MVEEWLGPEVGEYGHRLAFAKSLGRYASIKHAGSFNL
jgi:hypothetical protein